LDIIDGVFVILHLAIFIQYRNVIYTDRHMTMAYTMLV